jgi:hypothetical protein
MLNNIAALLGGALPEVGDYESIQTVTVGSGGAPSITFSTIPGTYKHLQIRLSAINTTALGDIYMRFNSDTGSNYKAHYLYGSGSTASAGVLTSTYVYGGFISTGSNTGVGITDILDYTNTNKNTTSRTLMGADRNGSGDLALTSGLWLNTAAITSITLLPGTNDFAQHSSFALYGIK